MPGGQAGLALKALDQVGTVVLVLADELEGDVAVHVAVAGLDDLSHAAPAERLSHDALSKADTGIWTGCYAASVACRYAVTRDAESLSESLVQAFVRTDVCAAGFISLGQHIKLQAVTDT